MAIYYINPYYLAHHGIKGMKWGVRRFRNIDGTLTAAGKNRYKRSNETGELRTILNGGLDPRTNERFRKLADRASQLSYDVQTDTPKSDGMKRLSKQRNRYTEMVRDNDDIFNKMLSSDREYLNASNDLKQIEKSYRKAISNNNFDAVRKERKRYLEAKGKTNVRMHVIGKEADLQFKLKYGADIREVHKALDDIEDDMRTQMCKDLGYKPSEENRNLIRQLIFGG